MAILEELRKQRWDDHRYYHHSRVNQMLHLISAISFLSTYALLFMNPVAAALLGWFVAMCLRQVGHFFFEPKGYDDVNQATHEHKEEIKVGYNLQRKVVLLTIWAMTPLIVVFDPTVFGLFSEVLTPDEYLYTISIMWLALGVGAVLFRTAQLLLIADMQTGLVWAMKILTDPFHDIKMYYKSPYYVLKGELLDPMTHVKS